MNGAAASGRPGAGIAPVSGAGRPPPPGDRRLTLHAHQTVPVIDGPGVGDASSLAPHEVAALDALGERLGIGLLAHLPRRRVRLQQYVGLLRLPGAAGAPGRALELLPRLAGPRGARPAPAARHDLLRMLLASHGLPHGPRLHLPGAADAALAQAGWLDAFVRCFCDALAQALRGGGLPRRYRTVDAAVPAVRGRLLPEAQLRADPVHRERLACRFDLLDEDHGLNQLFRLALARMEALAPGDAARRALRPLADAFAAVRLRTGDAGWWRALPADRRDARFDAARTLAVAFLDALAPAPAAGRSAAFGLLFDMARLFEAYVGRALRDSLPPGLRATLQAPGPHLMGGAGHGGLVRLRPDIVVWEGDRPACIVDTKWKPLDAAAGRAGVAPADLYQMLAYADRYRCDRLLLLYPGDGAAPAQAPASRRLAYQGRATTVLAAQLPLDDLDRLPARLRALLAEAMADDAPAADDR
jgi:5-methylcytosine-specific restriction enzyme subunit McrC